MKNTVKFLLVIPTIITFVSLLLPNLNAFALPSLNINLSVESSGSAPFDNGTCVPNSNVITTPGQDICSSDAIVRTHDIATYRIDYSVNGGSITNGKIVQTLPVGAIWGELPVSCISGSTISTDQRTMNCNLGSVGSGTTFTLKPVAKITGESANGTSLTTNAVLSDSSVGLTQTSGNTTLKVSATPRYDLAQDLVYARPLKSFGNSVSGDSGIIHTYPLVIKTNQLKGMERTNGNFSFTNSVAGITPNTVLYNWNGNTGCKTIEWDQLSPNLPFSKEDVNHPSPYSVKDSGTINCVQTGNSIAVNIAGADTTFTKKPTKTYQGLDIPADESVAVSLAISLWTPLSDLTSSELNITNSYSNLNIGSISGQSNFSTGTEQNLTNNSVSTTLNKTAPGSFDKFLVASTINASSDKAHDGYVSPSSKYEFILSATNTTPSDIVNTVMCDKIDNTTQKFTGNQYLATQIGGTIGTGYTIEWGQIPFSSLNQLRDSNCDDSVASWSSTFTASANAMRIKINTLPTGVYVQFRGEIESLTNYNGGANAGNPIPNGTKLWDFGAVQFPGQSWYTGSSNCDMITSFSVCDFATSTKSMVRLEKTALQSDGITPTFLVLNDTNLVYNINWTVNSKSQGQSDVVVEDVLPIELTYIGISGNTPAPTVVNESNGTTRLTWNFPSTPANINKTPLKYIAKTKTNLAPNLAIVNQAVISSPDDASPLINRTSQATVVSQTLEGFQINHRVSPSMIAPNANFTLSYDYQNLTNSNINNTQFLAIIPKNNYNDSYFSGSATISNISTPSGETVQYTKQPASTLDIDPNDANNQPGGSTIWCSSLSGGTCPSSLSEVTALKITGGLLPSNSPIKTFDIAITTTGNVDFDNYNSFFVAHADTLLLSVFSNLVGVEVVDPSSSSSSISNSSSNLSSSSQVLSSQNSSDISSQISSVVSSQNSSQTTISSSQVSSNSSQSSSAISSSNISSQNSSDSSLISSITNSSSTVSSQTSSIQNSSLVSSSNPDSSSQNSAVSSQVLSSQNSSDVSSQISSLVSSQNSSQTTISSSQVSSNSSQNSSSQNSSLAMVPVSSAIANISSTNFSVISSTNSSQNIVVSSVISSAPNSQNIVVSSTNSSTNPSSVSTAISSVANSSLVSSTSSNSSTISSSLNTSSITSSQNSVSNSSNISSNLSSSSSSSQNSSCPNRTNSPNMIGTIPTSSQSNTSSSVTNCSSSSVSSSSVFSSVSSIRSSVASSSSSLASGSSSSKSSISSSSRSSSSSSSSSRRLEDATDLTPSSKSSSSSSKTSSSSSSSKISSSSSSNSSKSSSTSSKKDGDEQETRSSTATSVRSQAISQGTNNNGSISPTNSPVNSNSSKTSSASSNSSSSISSSSKSTTSSSKTKIKCESGEYESEDKDQKDDKDDKDNKNNKSDKEKQDQKDKDDKEFCKVKDEQKSKSDKESNDKETKQKQDQKDKESPKSETASVKKDEQKQDNSVRDSIVATVAVGGIALALAQEEVRRKLLSTILGK